VRFFGTKIDVTIASAPARMTPSLAAVQEQLVAAAAAPDLEGVVGSIRAKFVERVGAFTPTDPWFEERSAALWDRVLCDRRVLESLRGNSLPAEQRAVVENLTRAQRGLFEVHPAERTVDVLCVVSGAAFRLAPSDDAARAMSHGGEGGWIDGHVVPSPEGVALLPGFLVHAAEATEPMRSLIKTPMEFDTLLDALLAMRHQLAARSRMKAKQIYRAESLRRA
jgi:hypothetical protein